MKAKEYIEIYFIYLFLYLNRNHSEYNFPVLQNGLNALHLAAKEGHVHIVKELLARGASVNAATKVTRC